MLGRVKREMVKRMESLTHLELYELVRAVNCRVIPVACRICNEHMQIQHVKKKLREEKMHWETRGIKSMWDLYKKQKYV